MKSGWEEKPLSEVCEIKPSKREARVKLKQKDKVSFVPMEDLGIGQKYLQAKQNRTLGEVEGSYTYFADGDVLLAKITPCFENGKLGIALNLMNGIGFGSSEYIVFRPAKNLDKEYLYYFLSQEGFREAGAKSMTGAVGHKRVAKDFIERMPIPIPPLPEQRRIVSILDKAFAAISTAKENAEKNLESARELLASQKNIMFLNLHGAWETKTLDEISDNLDSKRVPITKNVRKAGKYPYYGASGIVDHVSDYIFDEDLLLISEDGANLLARSTPIAFSVSGKFWVNNHAHILKFKEMATQKYVELYFSSIKLDEYITGAAQPKLNQSALNSIPIPLPPLVTQKKLVGELEALAIDVRRLEAIYSAKEEELDKLKTAILQKSLAGGLLGAEL